METQNDQADGPTFVCPRKHYFKDVRSKAKVPGPPWTFQMRCRRCTAMLVQIVDHRKDARGNIIPFMHSYLLLSGHEIPLSSRVYRVVQPGPIQIEEAANGATPSKI